MCGLIGFINKLALLPFLSLHPLSHSLEERVSYKEISRGQTSTTLKGLKKWVYSKPVKHLFQFLNAHLGKIQSFCKISNLKICA
jgi:hypothetical protein